MTAFPASINRLSQDHIEMRMALTTLEHEVASVAQYHPPDGALIGGAVQYFANFPARCHQPIEQMLFDALQRRAPAAAKEAADPAEHDRIIASADETASMARNLFLDPPKWRAPFCATARNFIILKREHIRGEEKTLFRLACEHLAPEDWTAIERAARAADAQWNDDPASARAIEALGLRLVREGRASDAAHRA